MKKFISIVLITMLGYIFADLISLQIPKDWVCFAGFIIGQITYSIQRRIEKW